MHQFLIREATSEDVEQIVDVVNSAYRPAPGLEGWTHESAMIDGNRTDALQVAQAVENATLLVATDGARTVGCVQVQVRGRESHIGMLAVLPDIQTAGLGKRLLNAAEIRAQVEYGADVFILLVVAGRTELMEFYIRRGYELTDETLRYPLGVGVGTPLASDSFLIVMKKYAMFNSQCQQIPALSVDE